jgi:hypothetical protein
MKTDLNRLQACNPQRGQKQLVSILPRSRFYWSRCEKLFREDHTLA